MTKFSVQIKTLIPICLVIACSCSLLTVEGQRTTCPQFTHYTVFDPSYQEGKETCRICPICPPAHGLPIQCGKRIANGTSTDCKPCANGTYSKNNDSSECKWCDKCEGRNVEKQCTPQENSKCGTCLPGYYWDPYVEDCKECFFCCDDVSEGDHLKECKDLGMPGNMQCEATDANKKCKLKALLLNSTTARPIATVPPLSTPTGSIASTGIAIAPSTGITVNNSRKLHPVPVNETEIIINKSGGEDHGSSGRKWNRTAGLVAGGIFLAVVIVIIIISWFAGRKLRASRHGDQDCNSAEQGKIRHEEAELQNLGNNVHHHQNNGNDSTTPLLDNQNIESSTASSMVNGRKAPLLEKRHRQNNIIVRESTYQVPLLVFQIKHRLSADGRTTPLLENHSTESSATSSTELLNANKEETVGRDTLDFDYLRIPEERVVSDMEWLRDQSGCLMLFLVQNVLDALDTIHNRTWRSVGKALLVSTQKLDLIETCYKSDKSPTEQLVEHFKTRGNEEPKMREFVMALIACEKIDVARMISNWPWEMDINQAKDSQ